MIHIEMHIIDPRTNTLAGSYKKEFLHVDDFSKWYKLAKTDDYAIINIMKYDPSQDLNKTHDYYN